MSSLFKKFAQIGLPDQQLQLLQGDGQAAWGNKIHWDESCNSHFKVMCAAMQQILKLEVGSPTYPVTERAAQLLEEVWERGYIDFDEDMEFDCIQDVFPIIFNRWGFTKEINLIRAVINYAVAPYIVEALPPDQWCNDRDEDENEVQLT